MVPIDTKTQSDYYKALDVIFHQYNKGGFVIKTIYCDVEYCAMMNKLDLVCEKKGISRLELATASRRFPPILLQQNGALVILM